jgi:hypothetical protein
MIAVRSFVEDMAATSLEVTLLLEPLIREREDKLSFQ